MTTLKEQLDALSPANDNISEPFQPRPTSEMWHNSDLWSNREGAVIRTGLYLQDRKKTDDEIKEINDSIGKVPIDIQEQLNAEITERKATETELTSKIDAEVTDRKESDSVFKEEIDDINDTSIIDVTWDEQSRKLYQLRKGKEALVIGTISKGETNASSLISKQDGNTIIVSEEDRLLYVPIPDDIVKSINTRTGDVILTGEDISFSTDNHNSISNVIDELTLKAGSVTSVNSKTGQVILNASDISMSNSELTVEDVLNSKASTESLEETNSNVTSTKTEVDGIKQDISGINNEIGAITTKVDAKADSSSLGTAASKNIGTNAGEIPVLDSNNHIPESLLPGTNVSLTNGTINSGAVNPVLKYRIKNDVIYISGSVDFVSDGQTSGYQVKVGNIPTQYMPKKAINGVGTLPISCNRIAQGRENGTVVVVGDDQTAQSALGAVMFSVTVPDIAKLTSGTWQFNGCYPLN